MTRTKRSDPTEPGITRVRRGSGFSYHHASGRAVRAEHVLSRIRELAIPPAWASVWICPDPRGHIQAVGIDSAGRRQYVYNEAWRARRDREKFELLPAFGKALPAAREAIASELAQPGLVRERVLACAIRLLDVGLFRVGSESYAEDNGSYGLTTLERRHVRVRRGAIAFEYVAKGGVARSHEVTDELVTPTVLALRRRTAGPRDPLLAYRAGAGEWRAVTSDEVNEWIKRVIGDRFSARYFRTWNATVLAAIKLAERAGAEDPKRAIAATCGEIAEMLGNTPAVCRESYIAPRVIERYERGKTIAPALARLSGTSESAGFVDREGVERAVVRLLV